jgi:ferredoxin
VSLVRNATANVIFIVFRVTVNWIQKDGTKIVTKSPVGMHLLDVAHKNNIDLEGACEGSLACSTCHVVIKDPALYNLVPEPTDEENDMLDLAFGLTETSVFPGLLIVCGAGSDVRQAVF